MRSGGAPAWAGACPERSRGGSKGAILFRLLFGTVEEVAEKLSCAVILSEAKNLLVIQISNMQILRRLRLLRMTVLWEFFSNL